ncbi:MAG: leucine--tRNA ligase, partial [Acidimicrobiia bacterium]|nr:leucine--tRNA ligase [Acidimicrobiia bacterium]
LNNEVTKAEGPTPRVVADAMVRMLSPLVPHMAEELWSKLGGAGSVVWAEFPVADESLLVDDHVELPVQVKGKVRGRVKVAPDADESTALAAATADENVVAHIAGAEIRKVIYVPGRMINIIV